MKQAMSDYIRQNENLRKFLLSQDGGILKYLAEHLDIKGSELFKKYQDQCDEAYYESQEWNLATTHSRDEMRRIALGGRHLEAELNYLMELKTATDGIPPEIICFAEGYLRYAYLENRKRRYPDGITPEELYDEVIGIFRPGGLANDCMKIVIQEHNAQGRMEKTRCMRNTMFYIRMYSWVLADLTIEPKLRQAVSKKLEGKTQEECRHIAVTMMKEVKEFSRMIYSDCLTTVNYCDGNGDVVVDKEWLRDVAKEGVLRELNKKKKSARFYFSDFVYLLMTIGHIWAAQMLVHGIDMHELETETGCILNPAEEDDLYYYVDNLPGDRGLSQRFVVDEEEAKILLKKLKKEKNLREKVLAREEEKQMAATAEQGEEMENTPISVLDQIPQVIGGNGGVCFMYYNKWANGKVGAISDSRGDYHYRLYSKNNIESDLQESQEPPVVAVGIVAYWLRHRENNNRLATWDWKTQIYKQNITNQFEAYTSILYKQFKDKREQEPDSWRCNIEAEFYTDYVIPYVTQQNRVSTALLEYITPYDRRLVEDLMREYVIYLETKIMEYNKRTSVKVPVSHTEYDEQNVPHQENGDLLEDDKNLWEQKDSIGVNTDVEWNDQYDDVFHPNLNPQEIYKQLKNMNNPRVTDDYPRIFVFFRVLLYLGWIEKHQKKFLKWANLHWKFNWVNDHNFKFGNNIKKELRNADIAEWDENICESSDIGKAYRDFAKKVLDTLSEKVNDDKIIDKSVFYKKDVKKRINDGKNLVYPFL